MRKTMLFLLMAMLLALTSACGMKNPPGDTAESSGSVSVHIGTVAYNENEPVYIDLTMYRNGEYAQGFIVPDAHRKIVIDAIAAYWVTSAAWEGVDVSSLDDYVRISLQYEKGGEWTEYYVYDKDGAHCMQAGKNGRYCAMNEKYYAPLHELAMGWYTPHTLKIVSGGENIYALRNWVWSQSSGGLCADGMRLKPQDIADDVEYIELAEGFAPYIDGQQVPGITFALYNEKFEEVEYPVPSGLAAWTYLKAAGPGRYVAAAEHSFEDKEGKAGYQYFFGLIIPESE